MGARATSASCSISTCAHGKRALNRLRNDLGDQGAHAHGAQAEKEAEAERSPQMGLDLPSSGATRGKRFVCPQASRWRTFDQELATKRRSMTGRTTASPKLPVIDPASVIQPMPHADAVEKNCWPLRICAPSAGSGSMYDHIILATRSSGRRGRGRAARAAGAEGACAHHRRHAAHCESRSVRGGKQAVAETWRNLSAVAPSPWHCTDN